MHDGILRAQWPGSNMPGIGLRSENWGEILMRSSEWYQNVTRIQLDVCTYIPGTSIFRVYTYTRCIPGIQ